MAGSSNLSPLPFLLLLSQSAIFVAAALPSPTELACKATLFPATCIEALSMPGLFPQNPTPIGIIQVAISLSFPNVIVSQSKVKKFLDYSSNDSNPTMALAAANCGEWFTNAVYRTALSLQELPHGNSKNLLAYMSASLDYQHSCFSGLSHANNIKGVADTMSFLNSTIRLTSNALCMIAAFELYGSDTTNWVPPKTERDGFWGAGGGSSAGSGFKSGIPGSRKADASVCQGRVGNGCYKTLQAAVDAAPSNSTKKFVIHIPAATYSEAVRVPLEKWNVVFLGDGVGKTVITGSATVGPPGMSTYNTATVRVMGDGFEMRDVTIQNTAGPGAHQAVAFRSDSDQSLIENCEFLGNQDTLYVQTLRQYYKSCTIEGDVDFIFGNAAAVFENCSILVRPRQQSTEKGEDNVVTAQGRVDPAQTTGFVFRNCRINGTAAYMDLYFKNTKVHKNYLGRPWKEFSRTVFINCNMGPIIAPSGWLPFRGDFALNKLFYGEFGNSGPGANRSQRVEWSSLIPAEHVNMYSVENFIQGNQWIPTSTS